MDLELERILAYCGYVGDVYRSLVSMRGVMTELMSSNPLPLHMLMYPGPPLCPALSPPVSTRTKSFVISRMQVCAC